MAVTVANLKNYLYLPSEVSTDDTMIQSFLDVAVSYLKGATDHYTELYGTDEDFTKQADLFIMLYASELYNNRNQYSITGTQPSYATKSLMLQLQTYTYTKGGE